MLWITAGSEDLVGLAAGPRRDGLASHRLMLVRAARWTESLWAMEETLRCPAVTGAFSAWAGETRAGARREPDGDAASATVGRGGGRAGPAAAPGWRAPETGAECGHHALANRVAARPAG